MTRQPSQRARARRSLQRQIRDSIRRCPGCGWKYAWRLSQDGLAAVCQRCNHCLDLETFEKEVNR